MRSCVFTRSYGALAALFVAASSTAPGTAEEAVRSYAPPLSPFPQATALPLALIHPAFIMVTIVFMNMVITMTIVTGSAKAVSVRCAEYPGYRAGAFAFLPMGR
jgi:hypothetical protein